MLRWCGILICFVLAVLEIGLFFWCLQHKYEEFITRKEEGEVFMISEERRKELFYLWLNEDMIDDINEDWRDNLQGAELSLVNAWDMQYNSGIYRLCMDILQAEQ